MTPEEIRSVDRSNMYALIRNFPLQAKEAVAIGAAAAVRLRKSTIREILFCGMGGSAIGGDLLRSYAAGEMEIPFVINRNYLLPEFVGPRTLAIISSYSGGTEETIACHREALRRGAKVVCITSGGTTRKLALSRHSPQLAIPGGLPPRAALGYAFFPLLITLTKLGFLKERKRDIAETITLLEMRSVDYANPDPASNRALQLAQQLQGKIGVVYSAADRFDAVNTRWRCQMAENAKSLMFGNVLPEMNHNELVGWKVPAHALRELHVVFLRDRGDHARVRRRMDLTKSIIAGYTTHITEVWSEGSSLLARMFSLIYLGDWVSLYLAVLNGEDPTPIAVIDFLKKELAAH